MVVHPSFCRMVLVCLPLAQETIQLPLVSAALSGGKWSVTGSISPSLPLFRGLGSTRRRGGAEGCYLLAVPSPRGHSPQADLLFCLRSSQAAAWRRLSLKTRVSALHHAQCRLISACFVLLSRSLPIK